MLLRAALVTQLLPGPALISTWMQLAQVPVGATGTVAQPGSVAHWVPQGASEPVALELATVLPPELEDPLPDPEDDPLPEPEDDPLPDPDEDPDPDEPEPDEPEDASDELEASDELDASEEVEASVEATDTPVDFELL